MEWASGDALVARQSRASRKESTGANLGFEAKLWQAADALRNNMDAAEYRHVVLGSIFLKYISDAFEAKHAELDAQRKQGAEPEDPDEYRAAGIFWVPKEARWQHLKANAPQPTIGKLVDDAMSAIERDNPTLKGVLPKDYARPGLDKQRLGQLINLVSDIGLGSPADRAKDILGRVYEYFLARFATAEGKKSGQFYTPSRVVRVLVEMLAPYKGRVYDPCCGSGGMFVSSEKFIEAHSGKLGDISIYGQESNYTTWRLAKMNLAIRGIDAQIAHGDTFHNDRHPDLKADYVLANPPFNDSDWRGAVLHLTEDELAFYDALETNDSAVKVLGDETLRTIAREVAAAVRSNVTIDWTVRENVRAQLRVIVKRILRKHGYPPDKQEKATQTVLEQAEVLCEDWAA
jgi:type I restriction enzyme M protein